MQNILVYVDDTPVYIPSSSTAIQACEKVGVVIPRFCYHDSIEIAGNCRICLVEIEKSPKPQAACGLPVIDQIRIYTNTPIVKKAREGVLEFLLLNHPLDCPICDQGGECDLQNQGIKYGNTRSRFYKLKRGVEDKGLGPLIKTIITRCIHCTRCIRFASDIAGVEDLGTSLRGTQTEVGTYVNKTFDSEVSANIIDLCPVGALTSKTYAFKARPWEITSIQSVDFSDCLGSNITVEFKDDTIFRVTPRYSKTINLEWLSDKSRYAYDGYTYQRLAFSYFRKNNKYEKFRSYKSTQDCLFNLLQIRFNLELTCGRHVDLKILTNAKNIVRKLGGDFKSETENYVFPTIPAYYQSTFSLEKLNNVDFCLFIGANPRIEASIANIRFRSRFKEGLITVINLGNSIDLTYKCINLGIKSSHLLNLVKGKHFLNLTPFKTPLFVYGDTLSRREDAFSNLILNFYFQEIKQNKNWHGCLRLPLGSNSIGKSFLGLATIPFKAFNEIHLIPIVSYILGPEKQSFESKKNHTVILETSHVGSDLIKSCDFLVPQQSIFEQKGILINYSGTLQKTARLFNAGVKPLHVLEEFYNTTNVERFAINKYQNSKGFYEIYKDKVNSILEKKENDWEYKAESASKNDDWPVGYKRPPKPTTASEAVSYEREREYAYYSKAYFECVEENNYSEEDNYDHNHICETIISLGWTTKVKQQFYSTYVSKHFQKSANQYVLKLNSTPLKTVLGDIYHIDRVTRASMILAKVSLHQRKIFWTYPNN